MANPIYTNAAGAQMSTALDRDGLPKTDFQDRSVKKYMVRKAGQDAYNAALAAKQSEEDAQKAKKEAQDKAKNATDEEKAAAAKQYKQSVIDSLANAKEGDAWKVDRQGNALKTLSGEQADGFHQAAAQLQKDGWVDQANTEDDAMGNLIDGKDGGALSEFAGTGVGYNKWKRPMWDYLDRKGLAYEGEWQRETAISWIDKEGHVHQADASRNQYVVGNPKTHPVGTWGLATFPNGQQVPVRVMDTNSGLGDTQYEFSEGTYEAAGYPAADSSAVPAGAGNAKVQWFPNSGGFGPTAGPNGAYSWEDSHLSPDEMQEGVGYLKGGVTNRIRNRQDLEAAREKKKAMDEAKAKKAQQKKQKQSGVRLLDGYKKVVLGPQQHPVGYAHVASIHEAGGHINQGSGTIRVAEGQFPASRVHDGTNDDRNVVTGADTVYFGGPTVTV